MAAGDMGRLIGRTLGDYTLNALVGFGGMAEVYRATDDVLGRAVAVKVLSPQGAGDAKYRELFRKEARRVAALDHPNIVPVYYLGEQDGLLFLVMPLMAESLRQRIERVGRPSAYESVRVIVQIAAALYVAHQAGIIHRDVKPENILLNAEGRPLLTDFGIARDGKTTRELQGFPDDPLAAPRRPSQTLAREGLPVGTPEYMAPEQLRMASVDSRVDIYALGAVLYELLTGRAPHEAPTPEEVAALTLSAPVVPPSTYNANIWPELEVAVLTALAYDPGDRFPDAQALRDGAARGGGGASRAARGAYHAAAIRRQRAQPDATLRGEPAEALRVSEPATAIPARGERHGPDDAHRSPAAEYRTRTAAPVRADRPHGGGGGDRQRLPLLRRLALLAGLGERDADRQLGGLQRLAERIGHLRQSDARQIADADPIRSHSRSAKVVAEAAPAHHSPDGNADFGTDRNADYHRDSDRHCHWHGGGDEHAYRSTPTATPVPQQLVLTSATTGTPNLSLTATPPGSCWKSTHSPSITPPARRRVLVVDIRKPIVHLLDSVELHRQPWNMALS